MAHQPGSCANSAVVGIGKLNWPLPGAVNCGLLVPTTAPLGAVNQKESPSFGVKLRPTKVKLVPATPQRGFTSASLFVCPLSGAGWGVGPAFWYFCLYWNV